MIQKPADFTRSLSCSTALSLPNIRRENLLTPGWSIAPNCRCMNPAWYSRSSSGIICSVPSNLMKLDWSNTDACPAAPLWPPVACCWAPGPCSPGKLSLTPESASGMRRCCSGGSDPAGWRPVMEEMLPLNKRQSPFKLVFTATSLPKSSLLASSMLLQLLAWDREDKCFSRILFLLVSLSPSSVTKGFCPMFCGKLYRRLRMEDWNLSILNKNKKCALRIARDNTGMNHESHTLGVPVEAKQWRRIRRTGRILFDTWDVPLSPGSNIEMRQRYVVASIRRSCKSSTRELRINPGNPQRADESASGCSMLSVGRAGEGREGCCWAPQWQSMISTSPKYRSFLSVRGDDTHARSWHRQPKSADITETSASRSLITRTLMELICRDVTGARLARALTPPSQDEQEDDSRMRSSLWVDSSL